MSVTAFSSGDDVIQRRIHCQVSPWKTENWTTYYEIERTIEWIRHNGFKQVALQFPDDLLCDSHKVASTIESSLVEVLVFILGDTSYSSCCVDEVGAQHYNADCLVHYGPSCLSPTGRLPVLYIFGQVGIDVEDCVHGLTSLSWPEDSKAVLVYDTTLVNVAGEIYAKLQNTIKTLILSSLSIPEHTASPRESAEDNSDTSVTADGAPDSHAHSQTLGAHPTVVHQYGRRINIPAGDDINHYSFIFMGDTQGQTLANLMLTFNQCPFYSYNHISRLCQRETCNVNKMLMKRYYLVERAKDANIVGIVVGTLGVVQYRSVIEHLKLLLKTAGKKSYLFVVGKLNPAKLANFAEVDIYVLVACPESTLFDLADFYRPIVSPLEMEIACNPAREWTGKYSTDFRDLLPGASLHVEVPVPGCGDAEFQADVSLISNRLRVLGSQPIPTLGNGQDLVLRLESSLAVSKHHAADAGEFMASRTWKGLEQNLGATPVVKATEGIHGIAASYQHESSGL